MIGQSIVHALLEDERDFDAESELKRYIKTVYFDRGISQVLAEARRLFTTLENEGSIHSMLKERGYTEDDVATAILVRAIEKSGPPGAHPAYRRLRRLSSCF